MSNRVGIVVKPDSALAERVAVRAARALAELDAEVLIEEDTWNTYDSLQDFDKFSLQDPPEKMIVIGGDGTLLRTLMKMKNPEKTIIMAVRAGKRGFLLDVESYEIEERIEDFLNDEYKVHVYPRLQAFYPGGSNCVMNDAVLVMDNAKLVRLAVYVGGERIMGIDGDGLVVSTTVGSTAYSLSAGGPIIDPSLQVIVLTPLNPVQLYLRPVVLPLEATIDIEVKSNSNPLFLVLDGQESIRLNPGDTVRVKLCDSKVKLARFKWWENYYERLYTRVFSYL
ncbi:MAG: NAD(+)/NADH kinase [Desulfurococcales archaeon]|nr:NAD(+)/NADH kinase [Desulfurococcales archaeon]MCE4626310.1 NAD(+)/NADH kinase [Desulfurococcales archaeon]MCE4628717.1 NAD(+)/NADH kinase [Desulfurococcales archaeon]